MASPGNRKVYGFNEDDKNALIDLIDAPMATFAEWQPVYSAGGGASNAKLVLASGGIPARSGTTVGSESCTEYKIVGNTLTTNTESLTVKNITLVAIPAGQYLFAVQESITNFWIAVHPGIIDLRLDGTALQYTLDGVTWETWHTGTECT